MTGHPPDFDRLGDLLGRACGLPVTSDEAEKRFSGTQAPTGRGDRTLDGTNLARLLALIWTETVGEEVAANARPVQLRQGRLTVSASSSAWAQTLQFMAETIKDRLNERLGTEAVIGVVFRHAGWDENGRLSPAGATGDGPRGRTAGESLVITPEEKAAVTEVKRLGLEPELEESILRAMRASFGRA